MNLTIVYITARARPCFNWFADSLTRQIRRDDDIRVIVVDLYASAPDRASDLLACVFDRAKFSLSLNEPKPTPWQGRHRQTKENWWAAANARNTGILLCQTEWISFIDDRCVLLPGYLDGIRAAVKENYAVFGSYEKRHSMTVEAGVIKHGGIITGSDMRRAFCEERGVKPPMPAPGEWSFGCSITLPLEWTLQINGFDELCDGLSMEDVIFGLMLQNNGFKLMFDWRMVMVEDRTPEVHEHKMRREDKGKSPLDKSHAALDRLKGLKISTNPWSLRELRGKKREEWPLPEPEIKDWYDGQPISEFA